MSRDDERDADDEREEQRDAFREAVLLAMDAAAMAIFGDIAAKAKGGIGATDADLPELFPVIDAQLDRLRSRYR